MAVTLLKHYERFAGLSTDVKPANAPMGSTFFEWDTSKLYTLSPAGWVEKKGTIHGDVQLSGSIVADETDKAATANTDILTDITATKTEMTTLMVATNTGGILKLEVDGSLNSLNSGVALTAGQWYAFDIPILTASVYNLQFSAIATMQIKWIGGF